ncbi:MAG TPA: sensor domain-containing diguanylate cyclase [Anaerolineales bacterium]|nr:sensor domain-containing diguanylate cyclase [Anaerolineales bacterium]
MSSRKPSGSFAPLEIHRFILPITITFIGVMVGLIVEALIGSSPPRMELIIYGCVMIMGTVISNLLIVRSSNFRESYGWLSTILIGIGLGLLTYILPDNLREISHILIPLVVIAVAIVSGRIYGYVILLLILLLDLPHVSGVLGKPDNLLEFGVPYVVSLIAMEAILRIKDTTQQHIHRLETINKVSRQIMLSLETERTISLLDATIQDALEADTYFVGIFRENEIHLDLFYDDGEYFNGTKAPIEGTLSGWVIKNQKELFLPDLRREVELEGVKNFVRGKEKTSLSWVGAPLKGENVTGVIALGSYQPNAFDSADLELLLSLAQHITVALDNTIRHAQVEQQARLDSMTDVYNHGYFLKKLARQAEESSANGVPLSLIMLDVDFFKQYNDAYGHLVGDRILKTLCTAIKHHIKESDAVGRWGGEEFIISLPGASGLQAIQVAERIGQTMTTLRVQDRDQKMIPVPTVSQGIAIYPLEADEIYRLIDLADRRLYIAKERGRNQIEPDISYWENFQK